MDAKEFLKVKPWQDRVYGYRILCQSTKNLDIGGDELILSPVLATKNLGFHFDDQLFFIENFENLNTFTAIKINKINYLWLRSLWNVRMLQI